MASTSSDVSNGGLVGPSRSARVSSESGGSGALGASASGLNPRQDKVASEPPGGVYPWGGWADNRASAVPTSRRQRRNGKRREE